MIIELGKIYHVPTVEIAREFINIAHKQGYEFPWLDAEYILKATTTAYEKDLCYRTRNASRDINYASKGFYERTYSKLERIEVTEEMVGLNSSNKLFPI